MPPKLGHASSVSGEIGPNWCDHRTNGTKRTYEGPSIDMSVSRENFSSMNCVHSTMDKVVYVFQKREFK